MKLSLVRELRLLLLWAMALPARGAARSPGSQKVSRWHPSSSLGRVAPGAGSPSCPGRPLCESAVCHPRVNHRSSASMNQSPRQESVDGGPPGDDWHVNECRSSQQQSLVLLPPGRSANYAVLSRLCRPVHHPAPSAPSLEGLSGAWGGSSVLFQCRKVPGTKTWALAPGADWKLHEDKGPPPPPPAAWATLSPQRWERYLAHSRCSIKTC